MLALPDRRLAGLAVIAFCAVMAEGVINDWSAIFLKEAVGTGAGFAALGYAAFSVTMVLGRLAGGPLASRVAAGQLMRGGGLLAAIGVVVCIAAPGGTGALAGFAVIGLGLAVIFPLAISAAGQTAGEHASARAVAAIATAGYSGFLVGPPIVGLLASLFGLRAGLAVLIVLGAIIALVSLRPETRRAPG